MKPNGWTGAGGRVRRLTTDELSAEEVARIRSILDAAFGDDEEERFTDDDWAHAVGGTHFILDDDGLIVTHASVVERVLEVDGRPLRTGYVEAVATAPGCEGHGHGSSVITEVTRFVATSFEFGALGTGRQTFYARLGWESWQGPSFVRTKGNEEPTADDDGYIMVLRGPDMSAMPLTGRLSCDWRRGDVW